MVNELGAQEQMGGQDRRHTGGRRSWLLMGVMQEVELPFVFTPEMNLNRHDRILVETECQVFST